MSAFGSSLRGRARGALRGWSGLGLIPSGDRAALLHNIEPLFAALDSISSRINDLAQLGAPSEVIIGFRAERDELRASAQRLADRVDALETGDEVTIWQGAHGDLRARAVALDHRVVAAMRERHHGSLWRVGLWTGGAVLGTVGLVVLVRYLGRKRR